MHDVNLWLVAVAFVLGLVLTLVSTLGGVGEAPQEPSPTEREQG